MSDNIWRTDCLNLGHQGENGARELKVYVTEWLAEYPTATIRLQILRPGEDVPYYAEGVTVDGGVLTWIPSSADTGFGGYGKAELQAVQGETIVKSAVVKTFTEPCLPGTAGEVPPSMKPWTDAIEEAIADINGKQDAPETAGTAGQYLRLNNDLEPYWATGSGGGGSTVEVTPVLESGTKIATVTIDGTGTDLYAPEGGGSDVTVTPIQTTGTKIATIGVDGTNTDLYAPSQPVITGKADKVSGATSGNFAALDSSGNLADSGHKPSDYLTPQDISGKQDAPQTAGVAGQVLGLDSSLSPVWVTPSGGGGSGNELIQRNYNFLQYESFPGMYDGAGHIVLVDSYTSYIIPIDKRTPYYFINGNATCVLLDSDKHFLSELPRTYVTTPIEGSTSIGGYRMDASSISGAAYITVGKGSGKRWFRSSSDPNYVPFFPFNTDSSCEEAEIHVCNGATIYPAQTESVRSFTAGKQMSNTSETVNASGRCVSSFVVLKKGTVINTKCTPLSVRLCGATPDGPYIKTIGTGKAFTLERDFWGTVDYAASESWTWSDFAPAGLTLREAAFFLRIIPPDAAAKNPWAGKTWYSYGTSVADIGANDAAGNNGHSGKFPLYIDAVSGMTRVNGAIGSGGIRTNASHGGNVLTALLATPYDCDLVTLETLPNDGVTTDSNVGDITDTGTTTICGAFKTACEYITKNTRAKFAVLFVTGQTDTDSGNPMSTYHQKYIAAKNKLKQIAEYYGVYVIDAEAVCDYAHRQSDILMADQVHPNYLGGEVLGRYIWREIQKIDPNPVYPAPSA